MLNFDIHSLKIQRDIGKSRFVTSQSMMSQIGFSLITHDKITFLTSHSDF